MDTLHQFLRISDVLVERLLDDIFRLDQIYANTKYSTTKHKNIRALSDLLAACKMPSLNEDSTSNDLRKHMKSFQGPKKKIIFDKMIHVGLKNVFPKINKKHEKTRLWNQYWFIHKKLREEKIINYNFFINNSYLFFENNCNYFQQLFIECYTIEGMTPYIHTTCIHLPEMIKMHGNIHHYCNEGLEKLNDLSTHSFFRGTNKRATFIKQMLERDARLEAETFI